MVISPVMQIICSDDSRVVGGSRMEWTKEKVARDKKRAIIGAEK